MNPRWAEAWFERFWAIAGAVSVRTKILGMVLALVLALGLGVTLQVRSALRATLESRLEEQAVSVARDLAARAVDPILVNDLYALLQLLVETQENNADVRYAFVMDPQGRVLVHTFGPGFPVGLLQANGVAPEVHHRAEVLETDEGKIWDVAVPIFEGRSGTVRVGLSETSVLQAIDALTARLLLTTLVVSAGAVAAAVVLTWVLTRPILTLARAARAVGEGDLTHRVASWANDEIGELADSFNDMAEALTRAALERSERDQLRAQYVQRVIAAQEEERKRIARELHDSTSQSLTSLLLGLRRLAESSQEEEARKRSDELRVVASEALEEVHNLALQLRPSLLDDLGLPAALERLVEEARRRYGLRVDMAIHGLGDGRLPAEVETTIYRIVQEALTNVARHAMATMASVLLEKRGAELLAIVEDDGVGYEAGAPAGSRPGLGIYGMHERVALLGGRLAIESRPGHGTSLFVQVPLPGPELANG